MQQDESFPVNPLVQALRAEPQTALERIIDLTTEKAADQMTIAEPPALAVGIHSTNFVVLMFSAPCEFYMFSPEGLDQCIGQLLHAREEVKRRAAGRIEVPQLIVPGR